MGDAKGFRQDRYHQSEDKYRMAAGDRRIEVSAEHCSGSACDRAHVHLSDIQHGYEIEVVGESERTARYVGIKVEKVIVRTMLLSGAICGLVGLLLVGGINHTVTTTIANGQGFTAVMVSWMAKFNPFTMIFTSFLIIFLNRGASEISTTFGLNQSFADILTGIILFFIIGCEFFIAYQIHFRKKPERRMIVND